MYAIKESKLTDLEKLEDKFDDIIQTLSEKVDELEYVNDRQASEIGDLQSDSRIADCKIEELQQEVISLVVSLNSTGILSANTLDCSKNCAGVPLISPPEVFILNPFTFKNSFTSCKELNVSNLFISTVK